VSTIADRYEILTTFQMSRVDALSGVSEEILIESAGRAVAEEIVRRYGARKTVVLCGPGNNGKDGRVVARHLKAWGWPIAISDQIVGAELIIDALYGSGLNRDFSKDLADKINNAGVPVIAIDVPSGLDGNSGKARGGCVKADLTLTFFRKKPAHVLFPGRELCGETVVLDIGISSSILGALDQSLWENSKPRLPAYALAGHKFNRGHAVFLSGDKFKTGAARLAAEAALKIGAGLVTVVGGTDALAVHANHVTAIMLAEISDALALSEFMTDLRKNAICVGPAAGISAATRQHVRAALASAAAVVLDADGLTSCSKNSAELFNWIKNRVNSSVVMTPHEGEFARVFGPFINDKESKIERARTAAKVSGATIVLKGADTVIAHPDGRAVVNTNAPPSLATAGSGDVLAGLVTGLLAQAMPVFEAASGAVWLHSETAKSFGNRTFTAENLVQHVGKNP
jgi:ADP-dependent NAD(P)H-hydrate dehydratase / NAD(P)H-hydrate epimerase